MLDRVLRGWFDLAAVLLAVVVVGLPSRWLTDDFLNGQDLPILLALLAAAGIARLGLRLAGGEAGLLRTLGGVPAAMALRTPARSRWIVIGVAGLCAVLALAGAQGVYDGYALSMDEYMAGFDAAILGAGTPLAAVPAEWRSFEAALQPQFVHAVAGGAYWSSTYLPVNAALRAAATTLGAPDLLGPLLAAVSIVAVHAVARRLWPSRPAVALGAAILLATSSQFLITAMTPYAMSGHLAFNLVWLWLFLRGGAAGHAGALAVGFLACGLHQLAFHPLFAAPFILQLWLERRWRAAALYTVAYGAMGLFWIGYPALTLHLVQPAATIGTSVAAAKAGSGAGFADQAGALLGAFDPAGVGLMAKNLIRFFTWQNPLTAPLVAAGWLAALKAKGAERSLFLGLVLTTLAMFVVLPYQGHGWGYRYLHGLLGSACLLAAWTFARLIQGLDARAKRGARGLFAISAALALGILFPIRAMQAQHFVHPYALADAAIRRAPRQVVLVDDRASLFTTDLVRNDPFLRNRPVRLRLRSLNPDQIRALCDRYTLTVFDRADAGRFGIRTFRDTVPTLGDTARAAAMKAAACGATAAPILDLAGRPLAQPPFGWNHLNGDELR